ncbi:MAG: aminotransferase class V-fold PLP-dependent enzyme [Saprospiraceae bacterium]
MECQKHLYNLDNSLIYLNGAFMSPMLQAVEDIGIENIIKKRNPSLIGAEDFFSHTERLKLVFSTLINNIDVQGVVPVGSASYGLANVATNINFKKGDKICLLADQFPSNYYIWDRMVSENKAEIKIVSPPDSLIKRGEKWNEELLNAITDDVKVVSIAHIHWADGTIFNLEAVSQKCQEVGAYFIIDGTQSVGALPFDNANFHVDALVCAGYKWLHGPYGIGVAYYGDKFKNGIPIEEGWINRHNSHDFKNLVNYQAKYREGAQRYAVGESSSFILLPMLVKAIQQLNEWTPSSFQSYCKSLTDILYEELTPEGFWIEEEEYKANHLFGIKIPKRLTMKMVKNKLETENITVSYRGDFVRVSPGLYNTRDEIKKFAKCLAKLK